VFLRRSQLNGVLGGRREAEMTTVIEVGGLDVNLAPDAFHRWAQHYYKCKQDFQSPHSFSPVPYFLLCRALELELKARHLKTMRQAQVKKAFGHNLIRTYEGLPASQKQLDAADTLVLKQASDIYSGKDFEYFDPEDALTAFKRYPDLAALDRIAQSFLD
jgi:hypothetical protein